MKPRLALDVDEVLAGFMTGFIPHFCNQRGIPVPPRSAFTEYDFSGCLGVPRQEVFDAIEQFAVDGHMRRLPLMEGAKDAVALLHKEFDLHVVTSRVYTAASDTMAWLNEHFSGRLSSVTHCCVDGVKRTKAEICKEHGITAIVEDCADYAVQCAEAGVKVLMMQHPWNAHQGATDNIIPVKDWSSALAAIPSVFESGRKAAVALPREIHLDRGERASCLANAIV